MASVGMAPTSVLRDPSGHAAGVDRLPEEMNDMKIRDDKVCTIQFCNIYFSVIFDALWVFLSMSKYIAIPPVH